MSPLMRLILKLMRGGVLGAAALLVAFIAIAGWQRWSARGSAALTGQDISFFVVMGLLLAGALLFARAIGRELDSGDGS
jgi:TRAP-type C4-dicarboxylate transport system permease small subunit